MIIDIGNGQIITIVDGTLTSTLLDELIDTKTYMPVDESDELYANAINIMELTLLALASAGLITEGKALNDCVYELVESLSNTL